MPLRELDIRLGRDRVIHAYDTGGDGRAVRLALVWFHGTPNIGAPPAPLFAASERLGIRWIGYDRPGYGGSPRRVGRDVASAAQDVAALADALGLDRFALMGHSGGGSHALACAALLPDRVAGVVIGGALAPYGAEGLDWFAGMAPAGEAALRAALHGLEAKERHEASAGAEDDIGFIPADHQALAAEWSWFNAIVGAGLAHGAGGLVDDDLAYVSPWGFDPAEARAPTLVMHGGRDRVVPPAHGRWLAERLPNAEPWFQPDDGHISVLRRGPDALTWLVARADDGA
jgi:pimeloyl-ACP methyl ester carboxylesterase